MCSLSCLRKTVQFINLFLELILSVCDHYHDPTSSPAYSSNVSVLFPLAPHPFTIHLGFLSVYLGAGLPARTFFILVLGSDPRCRGLNPLVPWAASWAVSWTDDRRRMRQRCIDCIGSSAVCDSAFGTRAEGNVVRDQHNDKYLTLLLICLNKNIKENALYLKKCRR